MHTADLIVIGGGPAGYETALLAARNGMQTVLVEEKWLGGTCLNEGCIPTKCLCHSSENAVSKGYAGAGKDLGEVMQAKAGVVDALKSGVEAMLKVAGVKVVFGKASFCDCHVVEVEKPHDSDGNSVETRYGADNIIVATGSAVKFLPVDGAHSSGVLTSRELLEIGKVPESLCIIGGGVIGMEFASVFSAFGTKVQVVEFCPEILPNFDRDIAKRLRLSLKKKGVVFYVNSAVKEIEPVKPGEDDRLSVKFAFKGEEKSVGSELVLMATGRVANVQGLELDKVGIKTCKRGIEVDGNYETSVKGVYAIGDVNGLMQLAHVAKFQGRRVVSKILGKTDKINFAIVPAVVFTTPELAMVGLTEEDCKNKGVAYGVHKAFYRANGKALSMNEPEGLVKILADADERIIGAHILGAHASDLIHELAVVMKFHGTVSDIRDMIHAHPSLNEIVWDASVN